MFDIHYTPTNDKCVDTLDLDFDAHDPNMTYERIGAGRVVRNNFLKIRCSVLVLRWRIRARARLAASSPSRLNSRRSKTSDLLSRSQTPTDLGESLAASEDHQLDQDSSSRSFTGKYIKAEGQPLHERSITSSSEAEDDIPMLRFTGAVLVEDVNQSLQNVAESAKQGEMSRVAKTEGNDSGETNRNDVV